MKTEQYFRELDQQWERDEERKAQARDRLRQWDEEKAARVAQLKQEAQPSAADSDG